MFNYENLLIVGSGGREHALGWKISRDNKFNKTYYANGNGGTHQNISIQPSEIDKLAEFAKQNKCFTIIGPETPLSLGIVDLFDQQGLPIFGPSKNAANLETSKEFAKNFMKSSSIPTADFEIFEDRNKAIDHINKVDDELVIKADGLASGKGVFVTNNKQEAITAVNQLLENKIFGISSEKIVIEKKIIGEELSIIAICDGRSFVLLDPSRDHKRAFDNDIGPNTGGMGSISPVPGIDEEQMHEISKKIFEPALKGMARNGNPYRGFLYAGLIIEKNSGKPYVLEFNARMGDPECQSLLIRMESNLFECMLSANHQSLDAMKPLEWNNKFAVCVIMASRGYPCKYETGYSIKGLDKTNPQDVMVFHSGTKINLDNEIVTNGGRVIGVTALGNSLKDAVTKSYENVERISWGNNQQYYRKDIGKKEIAKSLY
ncbi:MAG: phosphoribosylamine--glycine ligase [Thermoproteota archaeon]|nr:phosphoribosylamine--glycine ligase [Thermoproteota archaeon]